MMLLILVAPDVIRFSNLLPHKKKLRCHLLLLSGKNKLLKYKITSLVKLFYNGIHMAASNHYDIKKNSHQSMYDGIIAAFQLVWEEQ